MRLTTFLVRDAILPALSAAADHAPGAPTGGVADGKERVIRELVGGLHRAGCFGGADPEDITRAILRREQLGTTGIGKGIAIPHSRHPSVDRLVGTLGLAPAGLPFDSLDGEPVGVFVLLVSPQDQPGVHLRALEAVVRTMKDDDFVRRLRACTTRDEVWNLLENAPGW